MPTYILGSGLAAKASVEEFFTYLKTLEGDVTRPASIYGRVAWAFRCVQLRCDAIAAIPFQITEGDTEYVWSYNWQRLFWRVEAALLCFGAAYVLKRSNRVMLKDLQWLNPQTMMPKIDPERGISGFEQRIAKGGKREFRPEQIIYFNSWNPEDDLGPGVAPMRVIAEAAGMAANLNAWGAKFFERGAIPAVILTTEQNPPDAELERVRTVWDRMTSGVKNAWRTIVLRGGMKPTVVGMPVKDLAMPDLTQSVRQQIAVSFGVPETMVGDPAANFATAKTNRISFYQETVIPEAREIEAVLNEQLFGPMGLEFSFQYNMIEAVQQDEAEKADAVLKMFGAGIITLQEARDQMNLGEAPAELLEQAAEPEEPEPTPLPDIEPERELQQELRRWRTKARKRGKPTDFDSEIIPYSLASAIKVAMESDGIDAAFSFLKSVPEGMDAAERRLEQELATRLARQHSIATEAVFNRQEYELAAFFDDMRAGVQPVLSGVVTEQVLRNAAGVGIDFDVAVINSAALEWASGYAYELVNGLTVTTRDVIQRTVAQFIETPGMTIGDVEALLEPAFGQVRAKMIAVTEITRAYSRSTAIYQDMLRRYGIEMERVWQTSADERVCPICGPLNGQREGDWPEELRSGPPAHVKCRCWVNLRSRR